MRFEYSGNKVNNSEVIKRMIAKIASNKLISENESGKLIL